MSLRLEKINVDGYEEVVAATDSVTGLNAIVAIHNTALGPSCGGIRMLPYATRAEALDDVLRLSRGMSYKSSLAGIGFGGGKSVLIGDPAIKTEAMLHSLGEFVETFKGRYIAAKDMNVSSDDLRKVKTRTDHVLGIDGEPGSSGDPSPVTAIGVLRAMEATVEAALGKRSVKGLHVAIQGIGHVGFRLAELLHEMGATLTVADVDTKALDRAKKQFNAKIVASEDIYALDCDVFSPCARGACLNPKTIEQLKCKVVVGAANNQLLTSDDGHRLQARGILYAPDYAVNSGGIINIFFEVDGYDRAGALRKADEIYDTMKEVFQRAQKSGTPPFLIADKLAEERLNARR